MSILLESNVPEAEAESSVLVFHSENEIMEMIHGDAAKNDALPPSVPAFTCVHQQPVAVVWDTAETRDWCIGFCIGDINTEDIIRVDHLEKKENNINRWIRPQYDDVQDVMLAQVLPYTVVGDWDFKERHTAYIVSNVEEIQTCFLKFKLFTLVFI